MSKRVSISIADGIADVSLNRPEKLNALDPEMFEALIDAGENLASSPALRCVVLSGAGRAFCAGLDFASFATMAGGEKRRVNLFDRDRKGVGNVAQKAAFTWAELPVPETVAARLRIGQKLYLRSALAPGLTVEARVDEIRPQVGAMSRALVVIADLANPGPWRPEATVEAVAVVENRPDAVVVPLLSVVQRPAGDVVYLLQAGEPQTVRQQVVEVGARQDGWIEVRGGLETGQTVVVEGAYYLTDGARVTVAEIQP